MPSFELRSLCLNLRNSRAVGGTWDNRRVPFVKQLLMFADDLDIMFLQECDKEKYDYICQAFGDDWEFHRSQQVVVGFRVDLFTSVHVRKFTMPGPQWRGVCSVSMMHGESGRRFWATSVQFTASRPDAVLWRYIQARFLKAQFTEHDLENMQIGVEMYTPRSGFLLNIWPVKRAKEWVVKDHQHMTCEILAGARFVNQHTTTWPTARLTDRDGVYNLTEVRDDGEDRNQDQA